MGAHHFSSSCPDLILGSTDLRETPGSSPGVTQGEVGTLEVHMTTAQLPNHPSPWHDGERAMQARIGVGERMERVGGRAIRDFMPDPHRDFFAQLPFLVVRSVDREGWVWASLLAGRPGFATRAHPRSLTIAAPPGARGPP